MRYPPYLINNKEVCLRVKSGLFLSIAGMFHQPGIITTLWRLGHEDRDDLAEFEIESCNLPTLLKLFPNFVQ